MFTFTLGHLIRRVIRPSAAVRGARSLASRRQSSLRPQLEVLEDRTMPADLWYIGPPGGAWDVPPSWGLSPVGPPAFVLPGPADVAHIGAPGMPPVTVVHGAGFPPDVCGAILLEGSGATLINSGGSLATPLLVAPAPGTTVGVSGGTLTAFMVEDIGPAATNAVFGGTFAAGSVEEVAPVITNTVTGGTFAISGTLLLADPSNTTMVSGPASTLSVGAAATNAGSITVLGGGSVTASSFTSSGAVLIGPGSTFTTAGTYVQAGGSTTLAGGSTLAAPLVDIAGGSLSGSGTISGDLLNESTVANLDPSGAVLTVTGAYTQTSAATLMLGVGPTASTLDSLAVGGNVTLDGTLFLAPMGGYTPSPGDTLVVLTFGSNSGATTFPTLGGIGGSFMATYDATDVTLMA